MLDSIEKLDRVGHTESSTFLGVGHTESSEKVWDILNLQPFLGVGHTES